MKKILKKFSKIHWFDILIVIVVLAVLLSFFFFFYRRAEYITIQVKVTDQEVMTAMAVPKNTYAWQFHVGDLERDVIGRVVTEITDIESFPVSPIHRVVYLTMRVRATYDTRTKTYSTRGKTLMYGTPMRFNLNNVTFDGYVTDAPSIIDINAQKKKFRVKGSVHDLDPIVASQVKVGDTVTDSLGNELVKVTKVTILPTQQVTTDAQGNLHVRPNPIFKSVYVEMELSAKEVNNQEVVMFDGEKVAVGAQVPIYSKYYNLYPMIETMEEIE